MIPDKRQTRIQEAATWAEQTRLEAAIEDLRSMTATPWPLSSTTVPTQDPDPVRDRPRSWEERQDTRREATNLVLDTAMALVPDAIKAIDREAGERLESVAQAIHQATNGNTGGAVDLISFATQDARDRTRKAAARIAHRADERRYPAQNPRRSR